MNRSRKTGDLVSQNNLFVDIANDRIGIGSTVPGNKLSLPDSAKIGLGNAEDLTLHHDGTHSYITNTTGDLRIVDTTGMLLRSNSLDLRNGAGDENYITCAANGAVKLYYNNSEKLATTSGGINVTGDIDLTSSNAVTAGSIVLTNSSTAFTTVDGAVGYFGTGNDLRIYHDSNNSIIKNITGNLYINPNNTQTGILLVGSTGAVTLYHGGNLKFETEATGAKVTGDITISDKIIHAGDTNTAIRFPAADTITAETAGSERLRIDSVGRHGINVTNAGSYYSAADDLIIRETNGGDSGITIRTGTANSGLICFADGASATNNQYRRGQIRYHHNSDSMDFTTGGNTARLTIDSSGHVGINETDPDNKLHITTTDDTDYSTSTNNTQNLTNALLKLQNLSGTDNSGVNNYVGIQFSVANGANSTAQLNYVRTGNNAGAFHFKARNASSTYPNLMSITSAGRVGINEASPDRDLHVSNTTPYIKVESTSANQPSTIELYHTRANGINKWRSDIATVDGGLTFKTGTAQDGAPVEVLRIDSSGNVKLTSSAYQTLAIKQFGYGSAYQSIMVGNPNSNVGVVALNVDVSGISGGNFHAKDQVVTGYRGFITPNAAGNNFIGVFTRDASADKIYFGPSISSGLTNGPITATTTSVGIGVASPSEKLDVNGTIQCLNELRSTSGNDLILNAGSANRDVKVQVNDTNILYVKGSNASVGIGTDLSGASGKFQVFGTNTVLARFGNTISATYDAISIKNTVAGYPAVCNDSSSDTLDLRSMGSVQVTIDSNNNSTGKYFRVMNNDEGGAGTELFRVGDDGNLGLGIASPVSRFHVHNAGTGSGDHAYAYFTTGDTGSDASSGLTVGVNAAQNAVVHYRESGNLTFGTNNTERLRITAAGNVNQTIGADAIGFNQTASGNHYVKNIVNANRTGSNASILALHGHWNSKDVAAIKFRTGTDTTNKDDGVICFETSSANNITERLRIASDGSVNIGGNYTQTTYKAQITTASNKHISFGNAGHDDLSNAGSGIFFSRPSDGSKELSGIFQHSTTSFGIATRANLTLHAGGSSTYGSAPERLRIHSTGVVQIGDSTASSLSDRLLQIGKTDRSATYLELRSSTSGVVGLVLSDGTSGDAGYRGTIEYNHNDDNMFFKTAATERLRINATGQVSIGNNPSVASDAALHIELDGTREYLRLEGDGGTSNAYLEIEAPDNRRKAIIFKSGGTRRGVIGIGDSDEAANATSLFFSASSNIAGNSPHMVIDSSGRMGLGIASPTQKLDVAGHIKLDSGPVLENAGSGDALKITSPTGYVEVGSKNSSYVHFSTDRSRFYFNKKIVVDTGMISSYNEDLVLATNTGNDERLRITTAGRLGLGYNNPDETNGGAGFITRATPVTRNQYYSPAGQYAASFGLVSNTNTKMWIAVDSSYAQSNAVSAGILLRAHHQDAGGSSCGFTIKNLKTGNPLVFSSVVTAASTGNPAVETERLRIDSSGRLLLGTTTEGHADADDLTIATSGNSGITIRSGTTSSGGIFFSDATSGTAEYDGWINFGHDAKRFDIGINNATRLRIDSSGRVLIGTTTEGNESADELTVASSGNAGITIRSGTSSNASLFFSDATSGADEYRGFVQYIQSDDVLKFGTATNERLRIASDGTVLIGRTTKQNSDSTVEIQDTTNTYVRITSGNTTGYTGIIFGTSDDHSTGGIYYDGSDDSLQFAGHNNNTRLIINSSGHVCANQNGMKYQTNSSGWHTYMQGGATNPGGTIRFSGGNSNGDLRFYAQGATSTLAERMRITSAGTVNIGESSTQTSVKLHVDSGTTNNATVCTLKNDSTSAYATNDGGINTPLSLYSDGTNAAQSVGIQFYLNKSGETGCISEIGAVRESSGNSNLVFRTRDSSTGRNERLRITSGGNLLIASTSNNGDSNAGQTPVLYANGYSNLGGLRIKGGDTGNTIYKEGGNLTIATGTAHHIYLKTNGSDRVVINSEGAFLAGTTSSHAAKHAIHSGSTVGCAEFASALGGAGAACQVNVRVNTSAVQGLYIRQGGSSQTIAGGNHAARFWNSENARMQFGVNNTERFRIESNGDLKATDTSIGSLSDSRLKKNIADFTYDLTKFKQFKPRTFDWINPELHSDNTGIRGFVAQEIETVDSSLVGDYELFDETEDTKNPDLEIIKADDGTNKAKDAKLGSNDAMYISVIQQLITKIETLETKVAALESA